MSQCTLPSLTGNVAPVSNPDSIQTTQRQPDVLDDLLIYDPVVMRLLEDIREAFAFPEAGEDLVLNFMDKVNFIDLVRPECCKHIHLYKIIKELFEARGVLMNFKVHSRLNSHAHKIFHRVYPDHAVQLCSMFDNHRSAYRLQEQARQKEISRSLATNLHSIRTSGGSVETSPASQISYCQLWKSSGLRSIQVSSTSLVADTTAPTVKKSPSVRTSTEHQKRSVISVPHSGESCSSISGEAMSVRQTSSYASNNHRKDCISTERSAHNTTRMSDQELAGIVSNVFPPGKLFGGTLFENWKQHLQEFLQFVEPYQLNDIQKAHHFQMSLRGEALQHYLPQLAAHKPWSQCIDTMQRRFDSAQKKMKISEYLRCLRLADFRAEGRSEGGAFSGLQSRIEKLIPMAQPADQLPASKSQLLQEACADAPWLSEAKVRYGSSIDYTVINDSILLTLNEIQQREKASHQNSVVEFSDLEVRRTEEGKLYYFIGQNPIVQESPNRPSPSQPQSVQLEKECLPKCFNCATPGCSVRNCPQPKDHARICRSYNAFFGRAS